MRAAKQIRPPDLSQRADRETYVPSSQLRHQDGGGITPMCRRPAQETTLKVYFKDSLMKMAESVLIETQVESMFSSRIEQSLPFDPPGLTARCAAILCS